MTTERGREVKRNILGLRISTGIIPTQPLVITVHSAPPIVVNGSPAVLNAKYLGHSLLDKKRLTPKSAGALPRNLCGSPKTPQSGDRFIPSRTATNFEFSGHRLSPARTELPNPAPERLRKVSVFKDYYQNSKILNFKCSGNTNKTTDLIDKQITASELTTRNLPVSAEKVLDAPGLINNFFLSAIDWSKKNVIAVALDDDVYIHKVDTAKNSRLPNTYSETHIIEVTAVKFNESGSFLATATATGEVKVWNDQLNLVDTRISHQGSYITSLVWRETTVISGNIQGYISYHDVKSPSPLLPSLDVKAHKDIVSGLAWSKDGTFMASGCSSGEFALWRSPNRRHPYRKVEFHTSAVKAISWCPWRNVLATGGGVLDHSLCLWKTTEDKPIATADTKSQICDMLWSAQYQELVTAHATPSFQIAFWSYPSLELKGRILGHDDRVLSLTLSPNKVHLASASADETIRIWKCFPKKNTEGSTSKSPLLGCTLR